jgi:hypothetical protein
MANGGLGNDVILVLGGTLGRPPRDFSDYVRRTAATGVWGGIHA